LLLSHLVQPYYPNYWFSLASSNSCLFSLCLSFYLFIYLFSIHRKVWRCGRLSLLSACHTLIDQVFLSFFRSFVFPKSSFSHFSVLTATSIDRSIKLENLRAYNVCPIKDSLEKHPHKNSRENSFIWEKGRTYVTITKTLHIRKANVEAK
jgi:hypothetical protein